MVAWQKSVYQFSEFIRAIKLCDDYSVNTCANGKLSVASSLSLLFWTKHKINSPNCESIYDNKKIQCLRRSLTDFTATNPSIQIKHASTNLQSAPLLNLYLFLISIQGIMYPCGIFKQSVFQQSPCPPKSFLLSWYLCSSAFPLPQDFFLPPLGLWSSLLGLTLVYIHIDTDIDIDKYKHTFVVTENFYADRYSCDPCVQNCY